ncbi:MAG: helix-turn-helix transcriptional regulator [Albidovulum sp.]|nr:helix-turn-helix transcriptional regulator [Albidovulum sp.]
MTTLRPSIARAVRQLGSDINRARRARRMPTSDFASRMGVGRSTLARLERGDPGVSIGNVAAALAALGELQRLSGLIDPSKDDAALLLSGRDLPQRIRTAKGASIADRSSIEESDAESGSVAF